MRQDATAERARTEEGRALPLVVDLDGTLIRTDSTFENLVQALRTRPLAAIAAVLVAPFSRARMKGILANAADIDVATLPVNDEVLAYVHRARAEGRSTHLVTGAHDRIAQQVCAHFGVFDSAAGTTTTNLKAAGKAAYLTRRFPEGFAYIGDSGADRAVWAASAAGAIVQRSGAGAAALKRSGAPVEASFPTLRPTLAAWASQLRLHQWSKNLLIFAALMLAHKFTDLAIVLRTMQGFAALSLAASATYIANDMLDLASDRKHPRKRNRGFASGRLSIASGMMVFGALAAASTLFAAYLGPAFAAVLGLYVTTTILYSVSLKRTALLDVTVLAWQYTVRILMGGVLAGVAVSQWLLVFSMFFFLSLSLAKRHVEVLSLSSRQIDRIDGRGYLATDAPLTLSIGAGVGTSSVLVLVLYLIEGAFPSGVYRAPEWLWAFPVLVGMFLMRVWLLAHRGQMHDDPVAFAVKDSQSLLLGAGLAASFLLATFAPATLS